MLIETGRLFTTFCNSIPFDSGEDKSKYPKSLNYCWVDQTQFNMYCHALVQFSFLICEHPCLSIVVTGITLKIAKDHVPSSYCRQLDVFRHLHNMPLDDIHNLCDESVGLD